MWKYVTKYGIGRAQADACARVGQQAKKQGVIAVARKLLILMYSLWKNEQPYDPTKNLKQELILNAV